MNQRASNHKWWVLAAMTGSLSMILLDTTIIAVALPPIQRDLGFSQNTLEWIVISYVLVLASFMALGGRFGDWIGKPRAFVIGTLAFGGASLLCATAWDGTSLIAFRVLQALTAVLMQPASSALVISAFEPGERGKAMGFYAGIPILCLTFGPVLGGFITEYASWRWCFAINVPISIGVVALALWVKPKDTRNLPTTVNGKRLKLDWPGIVLLGLGLPAFILAIKQGGVWGWGSPLSLGVLCAGVLMLVLFVVVELRSANPIIQFALFRDRGFLGAALMLMLMQAAIVGITIYVAIYLEVVLGFSPLKAGIALLPLMVPVLIFVHVAGRVYDRIGPRTPALSGGIFVTLGLLVLAAGIDREFYPIIAAGMVLIGFGVPFVQVPSNTDGMSRVGPERRGLASGVLQTFRQLGSVIGLASMAAVIGARQELLLARSSNIENNGSAVVLAAAKGDTVALETIHKQSPALAEMLLGITASGIEAGVFTAAAIAGLVIVLAPLLLSHGSPKAAPSA